MNDMSAKTEKQKPSVTLPGIVEKVIPARSAAEPEKAQISVEGCEDLYKEIRVENTLKDANGKAVALKVGAEVKVTIEADKAETTPKETPQPAKPA